MLRRSCRQLMATSWRIVPEKIHYDVCVIGGGPAGIAAAMRAVDFNKKVCLIEKGPLGGCDLWNGALQSKTMWEFATFRQKLGSAAAKRLFGMTVDDHMELDEEKMQRSMQLVSETRANQIRQALEATNVTLLKGQATFQNDNEVQCHNHEEMRYQNVTADYFIIATGSAPCEHPFVAIDEKLVVTSNVIMHQPLPKSLVIIGAGVIGCEFASILAGLGKTKVSIIDKAPRILPREDDDIVEQVERQMKEKGVLIHHDSTLYDLQAWEENAEEAMRLHPQQPHLRRSGVQYTILNRKTKCLTTYHVDRALMAVGRTPNYRNLGLENTSLRVWDDQIIVNGVGLCKNTKHIFAVGDAATEMKLVNMGEAQAKMVVDYIYSSHLRDTLSSTSAIAHSMTSAAFLTKAVAFVGLNETECRRRNIAYICCRYGYDLVSRAVAAANTDGFIKILVSNDAEMRMLGVRAIGMNASTMVDLGSLAIQNGQTAFDLADRLTAYPAVSQAFQECLRALLGRSELKPGSFPSLVVTKWKPRDFTRGVAYQEEARAQMTADEARLEAAEGETATSKQTAQLKKSAPPAPAPVSEVGAKKDAAAAEASCSEPAGVTPSSSSSSSSSVVSKSEMPQPINDDTPIQTGMFFRTLKRSN